MAVSMQLLVSGSSKDIQSAMALLGAKKRGRKPKDADEEEEETEDEETEDEETEEEETEEEETEDEETEEEEETEDEEEEEEKPAKRGKAAAGKTDPKLEALLKAFQKYADKRGVPKARTILKKFGAKSAREIPKAKWAAALKAVSLTAK